ENLGSVGAAPKKLPPKFGFGSAPEERVVDPELTQDLGHLTVVTEEIAHPARPALFPAALSRPFDSHPKVSHQRFSADQKQVRQIVPAADDELAAPNQGVDQLLLFRPNFEVILHGNKLAVELVVREPSALQLIDNQVERPNQFGPVGLE